MTVKLIQYILTSLLIVKIAVGIFIEVRGNKISIKRKWISSSILTVGGIMIFIWFLIIKQRNIINIGMFSYLMISYSAIWFIEGIYLLIYCKKLGKQE